MTIVFDLRTSIILFIILNLFIKHCEILYEIADSMIITHTTNNEEKRYIINAKFVD